MVQSQNGSERSPLARLVFFMVCLSILGSIVAGTHYFLIDRPAQEYAARSPANSWQSYCTAQLPILSGLWTMTFGPHQHCSMDCTAPYTLVNCCVVC